MNALRRILSHWQHVTALLLAIAIFIVAPYLARAYDPTAGVFDIGYLLRPTVAAVYLLFGVSTVWAVISVSFPSIDRWIDDGGFRHALVGISSPTKVIAFGLFFILLLALYCVCLWLVPI